MHCWGIFHMENDEIVYEKKECLRAEIFKNLAYFFASITGIAIVKVFVYRENPLYYFSTAGIMTLISFLAALHFIGVSIEILENLDKEIHKTTTKIKLPKEKKS